MQKHSGTLTWIRVATSTSGEYWIVLSWDRAQVFVPVWAVKRYTYACDQNSYNSIELKPSAGTFEITMHTTNDQTTVHAQRH